MYIDIAANTKAIYKRKLDKLVEGEFRYFTDELQSNINERAKEGMGHTWFNLKKLKQTLEERQLRLQNLVYVLNACGYKVTKNDIVEDDDTTLYIHWDDNVYEYNISKHGGVHTPLKYFDFATSTLATIDMKIIRQIMTMTDDRHETTWMTVNLYDTIKEVKTKILKKFPSTIQFKFRSHYDSYHDFEREDMTLFDYKIEQNDKFVCEIHTDK